MRKLVLGCMIAALAMVTGSAGAAEDWPATKDYVAGSAGVAAAVPGVASFNNAGGAVDCASGVGGVCFDTSKHRGIFTLRAVDTAGGTVTMFAGFDLDGDGCVGCTNGEKDGDLFFQGSDAITGFVPAGGSDGTPLADPTLYVFVRLATLNTGDLGSVGQVTITEGCRDEKCTLDTDPMMGTFCTGAEDPQTGEPRDCTHMMYPYPSTP